MSAWLGVMLTVAVAALVIDFRLRIVLALTVALLLGFGRRSGLLEQWPNARPLAFLGQISYSIFLVHFPILLLANTLYAHTDYDSSLSTAVWVSLSVAASIAAATLFYRWIESPEASKRITAAMGWCIGSSLELVRKVPLLGTLLTRRS
jgi:peptidoglycan/LPS O-acetylase OafA/YrhL